MKTEIERFFVYNMPDTLEELKIEYYRHYKRNMPLFYRGRACKQLKRAKGTFWDRLVSEWIVRKANGYEPYIPF